MLSRLHFQRITAVSSRLSFSTSSSVSTPCAPCAFHGVLRPTYTTMERMKEEAQIHRDRVESLGLTELLKGFPCSVDIPLEWSSMDAFGHVNNTVYLRYFEVSRINYLRSMASLAGTDFMGDYRNLIVGPIVKSCQVKYKIPLRYPDVVTVATSCRSVGVDRFALSHRLVSQTHRRVASEGEDLIVAFNYKQERKAESLGPQLTNAIAAIQSMCDIVHHVRPNSH
eukprot:gb/GEZN01011332.1/.p1 GENE.gb/GEZN01011332.1/~~gb/GEZN01011332.1/.p1  ORF type:complete len:225 (+),score=8.11 gb/GEZN01011332.1/:122-796(+)